MYVLTVHCEAADSICMLPRAVPEAFVSMLFMLPSGDILCATQWYGHCKT